VKTFEVDEIVELFGARVAPDECRADAIATMARLGVEVSLTLDSVCRVLDAMATGPTMLAVMSRFAKARAILAAH
jgi:hypothetical protein